MRDLLLACRNQYKKNVYKDELQKEGNVSSFYSVFYIQFCTREKNALIFKKIYIFKKPFFDNIELIAAT